MKESRQAGSSERTIIDNSFGCVRPGQMLLVLARPGGGATTLLRLLSNQRSGYTSVEGDVRFGTMSAKEAEGYRGQIVMNGEEVSPTLQQDARLLISALHRKFSTLV
jgi:ATP-binding cassette subfamily G (WHITE) protein 2 (SNQ2)